MKLLKIGFIIFSTILAFNGLLQFVSYITAQGALGPVLAPLVLLIIFSILAIILMDQINIEELEKIEEGDK